MTGMAALASNWPAWAEDVDASLQSLTDEARGARSPIHFDGEHFSGPGYEQLLDAGRKSHFLLLGEEHGIAENPLLAAQLFRALAPEGYRRLTIEISPPMAAVLDRALAEDGLGGLRALYALPGGEPAFFGMREEAQILAAVRAAVPANEPALWGADYVNQRRSSPRPVWS